jgi:hypothetical protein
LLALASTTLAVVVPAAHAGTAARTPCKLVRDAGGDAASARIEGQDDYFDFRSGDVASDGRTVTVVMRFAAVAVPEPTGPPVDYLFEWHYGDHVFTVEATNVPNGHQTSFSSKKDGDPWVLRVERAATGVWDPVRSEVRISFPLSYVRELVPAAAGGFHSFYVRVMETDGVLLPQPVPVEGYGIGLGSVMDEAWQDLAQYRLGTKNCVTVGR